MAAIGRQLKQSVKVFQSLMLYLLLPRKKKAIRIKQKMYSKHHYNNTKKETDMKCHRLCTHTHHRNHIFCWLKHTRGFPSAGRSSLDIWFCRPVGDRWSPETACPCPHSHPETGSCFLEGSPHTQTASAGHSIARGCHLQDKGQISAPKGPNWATCTCL